MAGAGRGNPRDRQLRRVPVREPARSAPRDPCGSVRARPVGPDGRDRVRGGPTGDARARAWLARCSGRRSPGCATPGSRSARSTRRRLGCTAARAGSSRGGPAGSGSRPAASNRSAATRSGRPSLSIPPGAPRCGPATPRAHRACPRPSTARSRSGPCTSVEDGRRALSSTASARTACSPGMWPTRRRRNPVRGPTTCGSTTSRRATDRRPLPCGGSSVATRCRSSRCSCRSAPWPRSRSSSTSRTPSRTSRTTGCTASSTFRARWVPAGSRRVSRGRSSSA